MAHILVYLQRTPVGLHPASALALCVARDIGSNRGASVTALCPGDAGPVDAGVVRAAARFGADVIVFFGPDGIADTIERLAPVHLLTPWTPEGLDAVADVSLGPANPRWISRARPPGAGADTVTGIVAGTPPWHAFEAALDPEYLGDVEDLAAPAWAMAGAASGVTEHTAAGFVMVPEGPVSFVAPRGLDKGVQRVLQQLQAQRLEPTPAATAEAQTVLWFVRGGDPLPEALQERSPTTRAVVFVDTDARFDASWKHADLVVPGPWDQGVARLCEPRWRASLA